jgi:hypothetical protein
MTARTPGSRRQNINTSTPIVNTWPRTMPVIDTRLAFWLIDVSGKPPKARPAAPATMIDGVTCQANIADTRSNPNGTAWCKGGAWSGPEQAHGVVYVVARAPVPNRLVATAPDYETTV